MTETTWRTKEDSNGFFAEAKEAQEGEGGENEWSAPSDDIKLIEEEGAKKDEAECKKERERNWVIRRKRPSLSAIQ